MRFWCAILFLASHDRVFGTRAVEGSLNGSVNVNAGFSTNLDLCSLQFDDLVSVLDPNGETYRELHEGNLGDNISHVLVNNPMTREDYRVLSYDPSADSSGVQSTPKTGQSVKRKLIEEQNYPVKRQKYSASQYRHDDDLNGQKTIDAKYYWQPFSSWNGQLESTDTAAVIGLHDRKAVFENHSVLAPQSALWHDMSAGEAVIWSSIDIFGHQINHTQEASVNVQDLCISRNSESPGPPIISSASKYKRKVGELAKQLGSILAKYGYYVDCKPLRPKAPLIQAYRITCQMSPATDKHNEFNFCKDNVGCVDTIAALGFDQVLAELRRLFDGSATKISALEFMEFFNCYFEELLAKVKTPVIMPGPGHVQAVEGSDGNVHQITQFCSNVSPLHADDSKCFTEFKKELFGLLKEHNLDARCTTSSPTKLIVRSFETMKFIIQRSGLYKDELGHLLDADFPGPTAKKLKDVYTEFRYLFEDCVADPFEKNFVAFFRGLIVMNKEHLDVSKILSREMPRTSTRLVETRKKICQFVSDLDNILKKHEIIVKFRGKESSKPAFMAYRILKGLADERKVYPKMLAGFLDSKIKVFPDTAYPALRVIWSLFKGTSLETRNALQFIEGFLSFFREIMDQIQRQPALGPV